MTNMIMNEQYIGIEDGRTSYWYPMETVVNFVWGRMLGQGRFMLYANLIALAHRANGERVELDKTTLKDLANMSCMSEKTIGPALEDLLQLGFIAMGKTPTYAECRRGITTKIRVLNVPTKMHQVHIDYALERGMIKGVHTVDEYYDKYVETKWLFDRNQELEIDDEYRTTDLSPVVERVNDFPGIADDFPKKVDVREEGLSEESCYIDKKLYKENEQDKILRPAPSDEVGNEIEDGDDNQSSVKAENLKMTAQQFAEQHHEKLGFQKQGGAPSPVVTAKGNSERVYAQDLQAGDVALVVMNALEKASGKQCSKMTVKQYLALNSKMKTKDGHEMESPQWYFEKYPEMYRWFIEARVPELIRSQHGDTRMIMGNFLTAITEPSRWRSWISVMHDKGLKDGRPNDGYVLKAGEIGNNAVSPPVEPMEIDYEALTNAIFGDK